MHQKLIDSINKISDQSCPQYSDYFFDINPENKMKTWDYYTCDENFTYSQDRLINTIQSCEMTCEQMTDMVMYKPDIQQRMSQLKLLRDCADSCGMMSKYLSRDSIFAKQHAKLCADICETCGNECSKFSDMDSQKCAQICFSCAKECKAFAM